MRTRNVEITIAPLEDAFRRFAEVYGKLKRGEHVTPSHTLGFSDIATFRKVLTEERLRLLKAVRQHNPKSLYDLAKLLNRDLKSVNTDVKKLKELDLIQLEKQKHGRTRVIPRVLFDRMQVNIAIA